MEEEHEYTSVPRMVASGVFFTLLFKVVFPAIMPRMVPTYNKLSPTKQIEWNNRAVSSAHAVILSGISMYVLLFDDVATRHYVWSYSSTSTAIFYVLGGHLITDTIMMLVHYNIFGSVGYIAHHLAGIYLAAYCGKVLHYFGALRGIAELSTIFVNHRWFLYTVGFDKSSKRYVVTGILMTVVFFLSRIVVMPIFWIGAARSFAEGYNHIGFGLVIVYFSCFVMDALNLYWFRLMIKGVIRVAISPVENNNKEKKIE